MIRKSPMNDQGKPIQAHGMSNIVTIKAVRCKIHKIALLSRLVCQSGYA